MADGYEGSILYANVFWVRTKPNGEWVSVLALKGEQGTPGRNGNDGRIYVPTFDGRYLTWELRERPPSGETFSMDLRGPIGEPGPAGPVGPTGPRGPQGERGERGESAFDQAVQAGYEGTARAFYDALAAVVETGETAQKAIDLAKKNNHAHLFETRAEFDLWIADPQMTNTLNIGDFLFVKETGELYTWNGDSVVPLPSTLILDEHLNDHDNPHRVTAAQVGALTETTANGLYPRFRDENATTTVGNNHGRNVMASQNGENGGFYVTGVAGNPPSRKQWLTEYQRNRVRVYTETSGESKDYYWDEASSGDAERVILRWCDLFAQAVTTVWRGIMRMCNPRIAANADDASKDIALVPNANGAGLQVQFPGGATAMIRAKTGTLATVAELNAGLEKKARVIDFYCDGKKDARCFIGIGDGTEENPEKAIGVQFWEEGAWLYINGYNEADEGEFANNFIPYKETVDAALASTLAAAKTYADGKVAGVYHYKGSVATKEALPASGNTVGDVWNVSEDGMNYAWTGEAWDALGSSVDLSSYYTKTETDGRYLQLTGGTLRGNVNASGSVTIKVPILNATSYFSTPMLCNEPGLYAKNHALLLGYAYRDYWDFLEYGGDYRFYIHQESAGIHKQVARITPSGIYEGTTLLANKYAAKAEVYTKAEVDEKITSALGDISAALAAI